MSVLGKLNSQDFIKGLVVTVISAVLTALMGILNSPEFSFASINWNEVVKVAVSSGIAYLIKNFASDSEGRVLGIGKK